MKMFVTISFVLNKIGDTKQEDFLQHPRAFVLFFASYKFSTFTSSSRSNLPLELIKILFSQKTLKLKRRHGVGGQR